MIVFCAAEVLLNSINITVAQIFLFFFYARNSTFLMRGMSAF